MRVNKQALSDDLTMAFIRYQHRLENPMPSSTETDHDLISKYQCDPIFHAKVCSLTCGVMSLIDKHIE